MFKKYKEKIKHHFEEVIQIKTSPHSIALGFAIGTAIALLPTFGLGALIGLVIVLIFPKISKVSLFFAFAIWNPLVLAFLYGIAYELGDWLIGDLPVITYNFWIFNQLFNYSRRFLLGNLIITIFLTILSYIIIFLIAKKYQRNYKELIKEPIEGIV